MAEISIGKSTGLFGKCIDLTFLNNIRNSPFRDYVIIIHLNWRTSSDAFTCSHSNDSLLYSQIPSPSTNIYGFV